MNHKTAGPPKARLWGEFRLSVIGGLLASPPDKGEVGEQLKALSLKEWLHPITGQMVRYSFGAIEDWFYLARKHPNDPVGILSARRRKDQGHGQKMSEPLKEELSQQYVLYPDWTTKLHADNLLALVKTKPDLGPLPSYMTILRYMKEHGMRRQKKVRRKHSPGMDIAESRLEKREVRSYEADHVGALWHLDFHEGSRRIRTQSGEWMKPLCLAIHDDHSRLCCHVQWYTAETTQNLVHGLSQAVLKRGRPWVVMSDNGGAMRAVEFTEGVPRMGSMHTTTLPYSPYQNGKTERFWGILEGRLMAMLKNVEDLSIKLLNDSTLAWVEQDYNRALNKEIGATPYDRFINSKDVSRPSPSWEELRLAFRMEVTRQQRRSDGTVTIEGKRFEIPSRYRGLGMIRLRYARWDLSLVHMVDEDGTLLAKLSPVDKSRNAEGLRRTVELKEEVVLEGRSNTMPPLLMQLMRDFAETGLPSPYMPEPVREVSDES